MKRLALTAVLVFAAACGDAQEGVSVTVPVEVNASGLTPVTSDLGYTVTLTRARVAVRDLEFTVEGEQHSLLQRVGRLVIGEAHAHPGHSAGGKVTGELRGDRVLDWSAPHTPLGDATMLTGQYQGANFTFRRAAASDGLASGDPLLGHTIHLEGSAARDGRSVAFSALLDIADDTKLVGAPFELLLAETAIPTVGIELVPQDPTEGDTVFDRVDFFAVAGAGTRADIAPGSEAHNVLMRNVQVHDHYRVEVSQ